MLDIVNLKSFVLINWVIMGSLNLNLGITYVPDHVDEYSCAALKEYSDDITVLHLETSELSPLHFETLLNEAADALSVLYQGMDEDRLCSARTILGLSVAEALAKRCPHSLLSWEKVLWEILYLTTEGDPEEFSSMTMHFRQWVLTIFYSPDICSNPYLRLKMLCFIEMFPNEDFENKSILKIIVSGLVSLIRYLDCDEFSTRDTVCAVKVIGLVYEHGGLNKLAARAGHQLMSLQIGPEARCLAHMMSLASRLACYTRHMHNRDSIFIAFILDASINILAMMMAFPPLSFAVQYPGMAQLTAGTIIHIIEAVVDMSVSSEQPATHMLIRNLDIILKYLTISDKSVESYQRSILQIMSNDYSSQLNNIKSRIMTDEFVSFTSLPNGNIEEYKDCPSSYEDAVTSLIMYEPVKLSTSGQVVDSSTLPQILLKKTQLDPFTRHPLQDVEHQHQYCLQKDISMWHEEHRN